MLVVGLIGSLVLSFFNPLFLVVWGSYLLVLLTVALLTWPKRKISLGIRCLLGAAFFLMHTAWGLGFLAYFLQLPTKAAHKSEKP